MRPLWLVAPFLSLVSCEPSSGSSCRCLVGDSCWPEAKLSDFASKLSQPLLRPVPPESACYPASNPSGNCTDVIFHALNGTWRSDQPGSMMAPNFETYISPNGTISACYLDANLGFPCEQGSVPSIGVDARTVEDVQLTVKFASENNLRLVVKSTGHDFLGRSTARGSLLLWTHNLNNISYSDSFIPTGAQSSGTYKALTLGAGVQWRGAYEAARANNRFVLGGLSAEASVGAAGGWILGGGHSAFSARHGLGVDNVLQFTVVTADGQSRIVNSYNNADLFWAMSGGGGGTFGIVTSVTYKTHDLVPLSALFFSANFSSPDIAQGVITEYLKIHPTLADAGWGGYTGPLSPTGFSFFYVAPNISLAEANATILPFVNFAQNATGGTLRWSMVPYDSFYPWYDALYATGSQVGANIEMASRFIPRDILEQDPANVAKTLLSFGGAAGIIFVAGGAVSKADPDSVGVNPAWRKAILHAVVAARWEEGQPLSEIQNARQRVRDMLNELEKVGDGSYLNEATLYEKDFRQVFFGNHYKKLASIKKIYDPKDLFVVASGVGSERWDETLNCRLY